MTVIGHEVWVSASDASCFFGTSNLVAHQMLPFATRQGACVHFIIVVNGVTGWKRVRTQKMVVPTVESPFQWRSDRLVANLQGKDGRQHFEGLSEGSGARTGKAWGQFISVDSARAVMCTRTRQCAAVREVNEVNWKQDR